MDWRFRIAAWVALGLAVGPGCSPVPMREVDSVWPIRIVALRQDPGGSRVYEVFDARLTCQHFTAACSGDVIEPDVDSGAAADVIEPMDATQDDSDVPDDAMSEDVTPQSCYCDGNYLLEADGGLRIEFPGQAGRFEDRRYLTTSQPLAPEDRAIRVEFDGKAGTGWLTMTRHGLGYEYRASAYWEDMGGAFKFDFGDFRLTHGVFFSASWEREAAR